jgi:hypothetical protein
MKGGSFACDFNTEEKTSVKIMIARIEENLFNAITKSVCIIG